MFFDGPVLDVFDCVDIYGGDGSVSVCFCLPVVGGSERYGAFVCLSFGLGVVLSCYTCFGCCPDVLGITGAALAL